MGSAFGVRFFGVVARAGRRCACIPGGSGDTGQFLMAMILHASCRCAWKNLCECAENAFVQGQGWLVPEWFCFNSLFVGSFPL